MTAAHWLGAVTVLVVYWGADLNAQELPPNQAIYRHGFADSRPSGDYWQAVMTGGIYFAWQDLEIRAQNGVLLLNRNRFSTGIQGFRQEGLPRRGSPRPPQKRIISAERIRQRLESFLASAAHGRKGQPDLGAQHFALDLLRYLFVEGDVSILRGGIEVARAESLQLSPVDDRMVLTNFTLRLVSAAEDGQQRIYTVRGDKIVRQGKRFTGRNLSVTSSRAGEPHFDVFSGLVEIIERGEEFEIRSQGNSLRIAGVSLLPLPDTTVFTGSQSQWPVQGAAVDYSEREGTQVQLDLGGSTNAHGGAVHNFLTGRPASEFRGDWHLGLGWIEKRGYPVDVGWTYRGGDLYEGRTEAYWLDDDGPNFREILNYIDGTRITNSGRSMVHTESRVHLGPGTKFDFTLHYASDPAVLSEFFGREYREDEIPETSLDFRSAVDNRLLSLGARWNLSSFSYDDRRLLANRFVEQLPSARFDLFSERIGITPWSTPILLTSSTDIGERRSNFDDRFAAPVADSTRRADQRLEIAAPFHLGPVGIRPFVATRFTFFDETVAGGEDKRWSHEAGLRIGTRLSRVFALGGVGEDGLTSLRHVMAPSISILHRWQVDGNPSLYHQFDEVDALDEGAIIRLELLNTIQYMTESAEGNHSEDMVWFDIAQDITPISGRDNNGHHLGLFEYELLLTPPFPYAPLPSMRLLLEGEHDWNNDRMHTFNTGLRTGPLLGTDWYAGYRTDELTRGSVLYGASTGLLSRWDLLASSQYDLERDEVINYNGTLIRNDLDWRLFFRISFNEISDEVRFTVTFEPSFGGLFRTRRHDLLARDSILGQ